MFLFHSLKLNLICYIVINDVADTKFCVRSLQKFFTCNTTLHCKIVTKNLHHTVLQIIYFNRKFLDIFYSFKKVIVQAILTVVVIKVSPLYFRFSNSMATSIILLYHWKHFKHITLLGIPASSLNSVIFILIIYIYIYIYIYIAKKKQIKISTQQQYLGIFKS